LSLNNYILFVEYSLIGFNCVLNSMFKIFGTLFIMIECIEQHIDCSFLDTVAAKIPKIVKYFFV